MYGVIQEVKVTLMESDAKREDDGNQGDKCNT